jgi:hypothetical protein
VSALCRPDSYGGAGEPAPISGFFRQRKPPGVRMRHETPRSGRKLSTFFLSSPHDFFRVCSGLLRCFGQITTSFCLEFGSRAPFIPFALKVVSPGFARRRPLNGRESPVLALGRPEPAAPGATSCAKPPYFFFPRRSFGLFLKKVHEILFLKSEKKSQSYVAGKRNRLAWPPLRPPLLPPLRAGAPQTGNTNCRGVPPGRE